MKKYIKNKLEKFCLSLIWNIKGYQYRKEIEKFIKTHQKSSPTTRKKSEKIKIAFVTTWFGKDINGGAEAECYHLAHGLSENYSNLDVSVITTTLKDFGSDWNTPVHSEGQYKDKKITLHRFDPEKPNRKFFHKLNGLKLMQGGTTELKKNLNSPLSKNEEYFFIKHMVYSPDLFRFISSNYDHYDHFIFIPYMFAPVAIGSRLVPRKSLIIPCLHDERYIFLRLYHKMISNSQGILSHVKSELKLIQNTYSTSLEKTLLLGEQVKVSEERADAAHFKKKFSLDFPYVLYLGRKIIGKNLHELVSMFRSYKQKYPSEIKLIVIGKGDLKYENEEDILDLGFISSQDKINATAGALALIQPSELESFSLVMMEAWLQKTPVIVNGKCEVTKDHCKDSGGGLIYFNQNDFNENLNKIILSSDEAKLMGIKGYNYVNSKYSPEKILEKFYSFIQHLQYN